MSLLSDRDLLARLVGIDSTSANSNLPIAEALCDYFDGPGVRITRVPNPEGTKVNLIVRRGPDRSDGRGLTLCGHLDVVPATEPQWSSDPFELAERGDRYFGRGACDMKGFVALAANVFASVDPEDLTDPLCLLFTYDEELGTLGAQHLVESGGAGEPIPTATVIGEPTSLRVVRMHKGHLTMRIELRGRAAHSGSPHLGVNAIEPAAEVVRSLSRLREELGRERAGTSDYFPAVPHPVLNVARIAGGEAINVVPERCTIDLGLRLLPGQSSGPFVDRVRQAVGEAAADADVELVNESPPLELPAEAPIHRRLCGLVEQNESFGVSFASDAGPLQRLGLQCVLFGPGSIEVAHRPDEYVPVNEFEQCRQTLEKLVDTTLR